MEDIPENWPPEPPPVLPLFALPGVCLFPGVILPLHVFEERYVQLVEDNLDGQGRLVLGTFLDPNADAGGDPALHPIAGLGEIGRHERLPDGRYNILLVGMRRIRVHEVESDRLYRKVSVGSAEEISVPKAREESLRERLRTAILARTDGNANITSRVTISQLADHLALRIPLPTKVQSELFCQLDVEKRALAVLDEHESRPVLQTPPEGEAEGETESEPGPG